MPLAFTQDFLVTCNTGYTVTYHVTISIIGPRMLRKYVACLKRFTETAERFITPHFDRIWARVFCLLSGIDGYSRP